MTSIERVRAGAHKVRTIAGLLMMWSRARLGVAPERHPQRY